MPTYSSGGVFYCSLALIHARTHTSDARADPNPRATAVYPWGGLGWVKICHFFGGAGWGGSFEPKPLLIAERFRFNRCNQRADESVTDYAAELKQCSELRVWSNVG